MTAKNTSKTVARAVQGICEREHNVSPPYVHVLNLVRKHLEADGGLGGMTREEFAARVYAAEKDNLLR